MSKPRLTALDGLRGLAAFAVMLSHMGVNPLVIVDSPIFMFVYRMFSAGSNAVQVLFVLSGFFIAQWQLPERVFVILTTTFMSFVSVALAYGLFKVVESLYFRRKNKPAVATAVVKAKKAEPVFAVPARTAIVSGIVASLFFIGVYAGTFAPSLVMAHHNLPSLPFEQPVISQSSNYRFEFTAAKPNLSVVFVGLDYVRDPAVIDDQRSAPPELIFKLFDKDGKQIFESTRHPRQLEAIPLFPFGLNTIENSQNQTYTAELSLKNAVPTDKVFVKNHQDSLVTQYTTAKSKNLQYLASLLFQRILFSLSSFSTLFALTFIWFTVVLLVKNPSHTQSN